MRNDHQPYDGRSQDVIGRLRPLVGALLGWYRYTKRSQSGFERVQKIKVYDSVRRYTQILLLERVLRV